MKRPLVFAVLARRSWFPTAVRKSFRYPGILTKGVTRLETNDIHISRPDPLPENWSAEIVLVTKAAD
ncbi:hypothetical protein RMR21_017675 [Agrobacterium sp. rho-8.1]